MRKLLATSLLLAAIASQAGARAETMGHIHVGTPASQVSGGVTEKLDACTIGGQFAGVDGEWFAVTPGQTVTATLHGGMTGVEDLDMYFYDATCGYLSGVATEAVSETGVAPEKAAFVIVDLFTGAMADFGFTAA
jgi:hypothetical protein